MRAASSNTRTFESWLRVILLLLLGLMSVTLNIESSKADQLVFTPKPEEKSEGGFHLYAERSDCHGGDECDGLTIYCDSGPAPTLKYPYLSEDEIVEIIRRQPTKLELSLNGFQFSISPEKLTLRDDTGDWEMEGYLKGEDLWQHLRDDERIYLLDGTVSSKIEPNENIKKFAQDCYDLAQKTTVKAVKAKPTEIPRDKYWNCKNGTTDTGEVRTMIKKSNGVMTVLSKKSGLNFKALYRYCQSSHCTWVIDGATDDPKVSEKSGSVYMTMQDGSPPSLVIYLPTGELDCEVK